MMNKKGFVFFYAIMLGVVFFLLGLALAPSLHQTISGSMNTPELNCSNESISQQDQAICTEMDLMSFLYTGLIFGLAAFLISGAVL